MPRDCQRCGGELHHADEPRHCRDSIQHDLVCGDCGAGGTVVRDVEDESVLRRVGPAVDSVAAERARQRHRLVADGGQSMTDVSPRRALVAAEVAVSEGQWDRAEDAIHAALSGIRQARQEGSQ